MAKDDKKEKKIWEDDNEDEIISKKIAPGVGIANLNDTVQVDAKIQEARSLMEQTHQLYQNFFNGIEKRTPVERQKVLEAKVAELQRTGTNITTLRFKITQFLNQYYQMKDLWDRKLRERERK